MYSVIYFDDARYELYNNAFDVADVLTAIVKMGGKTFDEICEDAVCTRVKVEDEHGTTLYNFYGFNAIDSATLIKDQIISRDMETGEPLIEDVVQVVLKKASIEKRLAVLENKVEELTPYTETKTGYYGETSKTFYGVPDGNVTVFFDNYHGAYTTSRQEDRLYVYFDALEKETNITISIM